MRNEVLVLVALGRMPTDAQAEARPTRADRWEALIGTLDAAGGATADEARVLVNLLPEDESDCYGVAWTLVHVIESAPGWPLLDALDGGEPWVATLRRRALP